MYTTSLPVHVAKLRRIRAFLLNEAPLDDLGDLLSPFDAWVNCLETEIAASVKWSELLSSPPESPQVNIGYYGFTEIDHPDTNHQEISEKPSESSPRASLRSNGPALEAIQLQPPQSPDQQLSLLCSVLLQKEFPAG